tara:strand:+ start:1252 stop:1455 length:204 start_codon:yes stop_codon:yes gene_type:complete
MTYQQLLDKLRTLSTDELNTDVLFYDDSVGRYYPVKELKSETIDPKFPPLVELVIFHDHLVQQSLST